jgi:azurin
MHLLIAFVCLLSVATHASAQARTITIAVNDTMKYSVTTIDAKPGETLKIVLKSSSTMPKLAMAHNFVLLQAGTNAAAFVKAGANDRANDFIAPAQKSKVLAATPLLGPDETAEITFTVPERKGT